MRRIELGAVFTLLGLILGLGLVPLHAEELPTAADSLTPEQVANFNQQLEAMKALLLKMEEENILQAESPAAAATVSPTDAELATLDASLSALRDTLSLLEIKAENNQFSPESKTALSATLTSLNGSLAALSSNFAIEAPTAVATQEPLLPSPPLFSEPTWSDEEAAGLDKVASEDLSAAENGSEQASAAATLDFKELWPSAIMGAIIGLLIVIVGIWFWRARVGKKKILTIQEYAEPTQKESA